MSTIAPTQPCHRPPSLVLRSRHRLPEPYRFTVDQYERMAEAGILTEDDRVELINGIVVSKMAKGPAHVWAAKRVGESAGTVARRCLFPATGRPRAIPPSERAGA